MIASCLALCVMLASGEPVAPQRVAAQEQASDDTVIVKGPQPNTLAREGIEAFKLGDYALAERKFTTLALRARGVARFEAILISAYSSGDFVFTVDRLPDDAAVVYYLAGAAQARQEKFDQASASFAEAIRINSKFFDSHADYALVNILRGRPNKGLKGLRAMGHLLARCEEKCEEKRARYDRVADLLGKSRYGQP